MSQSPYQPPADPTSNQPTFAPPSSPRPLPPGIKPTSVTVIGILNLIFGGFGLIGMLFTVGVTLFMPSNPNAPNPTVILMDESTAYRFFTFAILTVGTLIILLQVVSSIGILNLKRWGRKSMLVVVAYTLIAAPILTIINSIWMYPTLEKIGGPIVAITITSIVVGGIVGLILPAVTAFILTRPNVKTAFEINPNG